MSADSVNLVTLRDESVGSDAQVLVGYGFNCFSFRVPHQDQMLELLWAEPGIETGQKRASGSGIPLLFPYPGRIRGRSMTWQDETFPLEGDDGLGNAIHGYVLTRPWRIVTRGDNKVVGQFQASVDDPELLKNWPSDFCITATYRLEGKALHSIFRLDNAGDAPMPCGFGTHPYFRLPIGGQSADSCVVRLPVTRHWPLQDMLPSGTCDEIPAELATAYQAGRPFGELTLDDVFSGLQRDGSNCLCSIQDPDSGLRVEIEFGDSFRECVVYTPPHREAICIEPYTSVPNAVELTDEGADAGLQVLQPGESIKARVVMRVVG